MGRLREPIMAATEATEMLRYATVDDLSTVACNLGRFHHAIQSFYLDWKKPSLLFGLAKIVNVCDIGSNPIRYLAVPQ